MYSKQINKLVNSSEKKPLKVGLIGDWLQENLDLYINTIERINCIFKQDRLPCFCYTRKEHCLFYDIYKELSIIETYDNLNEKCHTQLKLYDNISCEVSKVEIWLKNNYRFCLENLTAFTSENDNDKFFRRSFINGKNHIIDEYEYLLIYVSLTDFNSCYELKKIFDELFYKKRLLPKEYEEYKLKKGKL